MNWVQENKFLTGLIAVTVIGVGFLGYKVMSASAALDAANENYAAKSSEYQRLRTLPIYPNRKNLEVFETQKKEAAEVITAFQADLAKREFPIENISPEEFQDRLKVAVTATQEKLKQAGVSLVGNDKFYLGFNRYETQPPDKDAAAALGRQLKAIEWVVQQAISSGIAELRSLTRPELPEEKGRAGAAGNRAPERQGPGGQRGGQGGRGGAGGGGANANRADLVATQTFDLVVFGRQQRLSNFLNAVVNPSAPQFFIPRGVKITNQNVKGPPRTVEAPPAPASSDGTTPAAPVAPAANESYIVGEEQVELALRLEIVDFAEPAAAQASAKK